MNAKWGKQLFLNDATGSDSGALKAYVKLRDGNKYRDEDSKPYLSADLEVWDCSEKAVLSFHTSASNIAARRRKIRRLRDFVNAFADRYEASLDDLEVALAEHKAKPKKEEKK